VKTLHSYSKVVHHIKNRILFQTRERQFMDGGMGRHLFSQEFASGVYVVYSYGRHFPLFIYDPDVGWCVNEDKHSKTTTRHKCRFAPCSEMKSFGTDTMQMIVQCGGFVKLMARRVSE
jgi:hypothetical protein